MRDILLTLVMAGLLPVALVRPVVGAYLWAWLSIMNPHQLAYGFARGVPWAMVTAIVTMIGFALSRHRKPLPMNTGTVLLLMLMAWMTLTSFFAITIPSEVWERWEFAMKIFVMLLVTMMLVRGRRQIEILLAVIVFSVGIYGVKGGLWTLITGGSSRVWGPPGGMIQGNNELAVALVMMLPWMYYLFQTSANRLIRRGLVVAMVLCAFGIVGTQSRGALLALVGMGWLLGLKAGRPVATSVVVALLLVLVVAFMPDSWTDRMETIRDFRDDGSAMSRLFTWQTLWNVALDRPFVGAGFRADNSYVFATYGPWGTFDVFWRDTVYVAHSIYFQALGEHGFVGLGLYLGLGFWTWRTAGRLARETRGDAEFGPWVRPLMQMTQVSLFGFAIGGAFLSLMLLDIPYYMVAIVAITQSTVRAAQRAEQPARVPALV